MTTLRELALRASGPHVPGSTDQGYPPTPRLLAFTAALAACEPLQAYDHGSDTKNARELGVALAAKFGAYMSDHAATAELRTADVDPTLAGHEFNPLTGKWDEPVGSVSQTVEVRGIVSGDLEGYVQIDFVP